MTTSAKDGKTDKRERILEAARAVFSERGYEKASVSEIVRRAGVAQGTFYLYFDSKADLPQAFAEELQEIVFRRLMRSLGNVEDDKDLFATMEAMLHTIVKTAKSFGAVFDIIASDTSVLSENLAYSKNHRADSFYQLMKRLLGRYQSRGLLGDTVDLNVMVRLIDGVMVRVAHDLLLSDIDFDEDAYIKQTAAFLCRAMGARN